MARRKKTSAFEDLADLIAMLPWWVGVILAVVAYLVLHHVATRPLPQLSQPGQMGQMVTQSMFRALALWGQYVVPVICLVGAAMSVWRRRERQRLVANVSASPSARALDGINWQEFERLVGEAFRMQGYTVLETGGGGADGGVDLVLTRDGEQHLVQCKQWRAFKVGVEVVRELYGVMAAKGAAGGFVVTSGRFTDEAAAFAKGRNVHLIDGPKLHGWIQQVQRVSPTSTSVAGDATAASVAPTAQAAGHVPACPICSRAMTRRVARKGTSVGGEFWGCTAFPGCRGTRPI
jgi:restriction system protein